MEYHKRKLLEIGPSTFDVWISRHAPRAIADRNARRQLKKWKFHYEALIKLGYLEERLFVVTNRPDQVAMALWTDCPQHPNISWEFGGPSYGDTNKVAVTAPPDEMARWEKLIRKFDAPSEK